MGSEDGGDWFGSSVAVGMAFRSMYGLCEWHETLPAGEAKPDVARQLCSESVRFQSPV